MATTNGDQSVPAIRVSGLEYRYPDAKAGQREAIVDHATAKMSVAFAFDPGARVRLGAVRTEPAGLIRPGVVEKIKQWRPGDYYAPDKLADLRRDLGPQHGDVGSECGVRLDGVVGEQRREDRQPDRAADLADERVETGGVRHLVARDRAERGPERWF